MASRNPRWQDLQTKQREKRPSEIAQTEAEKEEYRRQQAERNTLRNTDAKPESAKK